MKSVCVSWTKRIAPHITEIISLYSQFTSVEFMMLSPSIAGKIFRNYKKAADAGDANSMFHVGVCYSVGYGVSKDEKKALEWCIKAAKVGSLDAMLYLAENCDIGELPVSAEMSFAWYHDAAKSGHLRAIWKV